MSVSSGQHTVPGVPAIQPGSRGVAGHGYMAWWVFDPHYQVQHHVIVPTCAASNCQLRFGETLHGNPGASDKLEHDLGDGQVPGVVVEQPSESHHGHPGAVDHPAHDHGDGQNNKHTS